ncbi:acyl-CoA dehydrogenase family protein [Pseudonocardia sp. RS010]|uniref:acyl-CoA dehydrogenase family protein n=1 Tax=Pseudonocardia sp. RS010 TaxID=3385979 RepID=UPI0039A1A304
MRDFLAPPVPVVPAPFHTPEREKLQERARAFAAERVLPVADELDKVKGEIPRSLLDEMAELGYFGITVGAGRLPRGAHRPPHRQDRLPRFRHVGPGVRRPAGACPPG